MPRYEFKDGKSNKFWEIELDGSSFTTTYGKIGTDGQSSSKEFDSPEKARKEYDKIVNEKVKKGYVLVAGGDGDEHEDGDGDGDDAEAAGATNPELEAAIYEDPDAADPYLVYGDWLQAQGDPRGELIVVQHALLAKPEFRKFQELSRKEAELLEKHREHLLGETLAEFQSENADLLKLGWQLGFIKSARIANNYEAEAELDEILRALLQHPSAKFLQELTLGFWVPDGENEYSNAIEVLASLKKPQTLRSLFIGDFEYPDETEMSWSHLGDAGKLWKLYPRLQKVTLQSGNMTLGKIDLPACREFEVRTGGLDAGCIKSICEANWPNLEKLHVWFGDDNYGAEGTIESIQSILDGKGLGKLKHLGLMNALFTDDIAKALPNSKILKQLETLDLSMGCLTDDGVAAILANKEAFKHLKSLNVEDNAVADEEQLGKLEGICASVRFGDQSADRVEEDYRYTSVGE